MTFRALSYASPQQPIGKRMMIQAIEEISGRRRFLPLYRHWQEDNARHRAHMMGRLLELIDVQLNVSGVWPQRIPDAQKLLMIANHPFGIGDGIAMLSLAEQLGRPYKVLINNELLKIEEIRPHALPVDFSGTRQALKTNVLTRRNALDALNNGTTIVVFPGGGVATARQPFGGRALELPWQPFIARLVQSAEASVLPVYFEGQNSALFHIASHISETLRTSLLVSEFRRFAGSMVPVRVGEAVPFSALRNKRDRHALIAELYEHVFSLGSDHVAINDDDKFFVPPGNLAKSLQANLARRRLPQRHAA